VIARLREGAATLAPETRGALAMMLAMLLFISMDSVAKYLGETLPPMMVVWARYTGQTLLLVVLFLPRLPGLMRTAAPGLQALRSVLLFAVTSLFFTGLARMELAEATALMDVAPLIITVLAALVLREQVGPRRWAAVAVGFLGALVILRPGMEVFQPAALPVLLAAFCLAAYQIATRMMGAVDSIWTTMLYTTLFGAVVSTAILPMVWQTPPLALLPLLAGIGLIGFAGHLCLVWALGQAPASVLAPFNYTQMVWSVLLGWLIFAELPDAATVAGAAIIIAAGLYVWHRERVRAPSPRHGPPRA